MASIAALIINYNGGRILLDALSALPEAGLPAGSVILVDNASSDGSHLEAARRFPDLTLLETGGWISFAAANNLGLRHLAAAGAPDHVLFLNNDAVLGPACVEGLRRALNGNPGAGAAAPIIHLESGALWYAGGDIDWREAGARLRGQGEADRPEFHQPGLVSFSPLCVLLVPWQVLEVTGLFDENYFFYDEDLEWCLRLARSGFGIAYTPSAEAVHHAGHSTSQRGEAFVYHQMARNRLLTMRRYGNPGRWAAFIPWFGAMMLWKALKFTLRGRPGTAAAIFSGLGRGIADGLAPAPSLTLTPSLSLTGGGRQAPTSSLPSPLPSPHRGKGKREGV